MTLLPRTIPKVPTSISRTAAVQQIYPNNTVQIMKENDQLLTIHLDHLKLAPFGESVTNIVLDSETADPPFPTGHGPPTPASIPPDDLGTGNIYIQTHPKPQVPFAATPTPHLPEELPIVWPNKLEYTFHLYFQFLIRNNHITCKGIHNLFRADGVGAPERRDISSSSIGAPGVVDTAQDQGHCGQINERISF